MRRTILAVFALLAIATAGCGTAQTVVDNKEASDVLQIAVTTAVAYGVTHNGSYSGMDAAGLAMINGQLKWTDAEPEPGQVQIASADDDNYAIIYKNPRGTVYTATRLNGEVTFADSKGTKL
ncbi:MAG: hypothetical protein WC891_06430 [Actinomycetota bacterium]